MDELRDIKPYIETSELLYWCVMGFVILLIVAILIWTILTGKRWIQNRKKDMRKVYFGKLKSIDWNNPKRSAYDISKYGRLLASDSRSKEIFSQLEPMLTAYKYKKKVNDIDVDTVNHYNLFMQVLDGTI
jgi:hypothetical protein